MITATLGRSEIPVNPFIPTDWSHERNYPRLVPAWHPSMEDQCPLSRWSKPVCKGRHALASAEFEDETGRVHALCHPCWQQIWQASMAHRHDERTHRRQEAYQQHLAVAYWKVLLLWERRAASSRRACAPTRSSCRQLFLR